MVCAGDECCNIDTPLLDNGGGEEWRVSNIDLTSVGDGIRVCSAVFLTFSILFLSRLLLLLLFLIGAGGGICSLKSFCCGGGGGGGSSSDISSMMNALSISNDLGSTVFGVMLGPVLDGVSGDTGPF